MATTAHDKTVINRTLVLHNLRAESWSTEGLFPRAKLEIAAKKPKSINVTTNNTLPHLALPLARLLNRAVFVPARRPLGTPFRIQQKDKLK
jgi:hypothetical protein